MWDTYHVRILESMRVNLVSMLDVINTGLLNGLAEKGVLGTTQHENLLAENTNFQRASKLISILLKKSSEQFKIFLECLREFEHSHVADMLGFARPTIYLISPQGNETELGIKATLEEMKRMVKFVDENIDVRILTPAEMMNIQIAPMKKIIGVFPEAANMAFEFSEIPEKELCGVVARTLSSLQIKERRETLRYLNRLALTCFMSVDLFEDWKFQLEETLNHRRMVYIPVSISIHETYFASPQVNFPMRVVVDMQTMESKPDNFEIILHVLEDINVQGLAKVKLCVLLVSLQSEIKDHIVEKAKDRDIELDCVECIDKSDVNTMIENSIWLFPGGDKYLTWTSLRPTVHGIPHIITKDSQLFQIHKHAEPSLKEGLIWESSSDKNASIGHLKECLAAVLDNIPNAFEKARSFTKWFMTFKYVIKSATQFLMYAFDNNLAQVIVRVRDCLEQNTKVMVDTLLSGQVAMNDSPLHSLVRDAWSSYMGETPLVSVEDGSIVLHIYVPDIKAWTKLQRHFKDGNLGEAMLDLIVILWRSSFPEKSLSEVTLDMQLNPPPPLRSIFPAERREASMITSGKDGRDILCRAAAAGASDAVAYLIHRHDPAGATDMPWYIPLMEACRAGQQAIVTLLLERYPELIESHGEHALVQARKSGKVQIVQLLEDKMKPKERMWKTLHTSGSSLYPTPLDQDKPDNMDEEHREIIRKNRVYLVETLDVTKTSLLDHLVQEGVMSQEQLAAIKEIYNQNNQLAAAILDHLDKRTSDDWRTFLRCVSKCGQDHVIKKVSADPEIQRLQCLLAEKILEYHNTSEVWQKENEFREVSLDDIFVDLELTKGNIDGGSNAEEEKLGGYQDIYNELLKNRTVVIFGPPGSGKSTLSKRLCCDWAKVQEDNAVATDDLTLHNFSFILPIPLLAVKTDQTFQEYVCETYKIKRKDAQALFNCIEKHQENVVLVLDEKENYNENTSEEMTHLLYRQIFPKVKMLITSRTLSLPTFCNDSPIATLCLQGFPDAGVKKYVKNMYTTEGEGLIEYIRESEYRKHMSRLPAFLQMIYIAWQEKSWTVDAFFFMFVAYTIQRARRKQKGAGRLKKSNEEIISENKLLLIMLGQLAKENVKPGKMELQFYWDQVCNYQTDFGDLMFEFLIEHKHKEETVYMFAHETLQEFFLSLFLVNQREPTQDDILLEFCNCRPAFAGSRVEEILQGFQSPDLARNIRIISSGDETQLAVLHTQLQLQYVYRNKDVSVTLPKAMQMSTLDCSLDFPWNRYLAMDGSNLVKLTFEAQESFLGSLRRLNAPHLTSLTLILVDAHLAQNTANYEQIEEIFNRFPLTKLEIKKSFINSPDYVKSEAVTAACRFPGLEELSFTQVSFTSDYIQHLKQRLNESVLKTLIISKCELVDAVSRSSSLERLDISGNLNFEDAGLLVDVAEKFSKLRKLNLIGNNLSEDMKQIIKEKLKKYPQLEVKM